MQCKCSEIQEKILVTALIDKNGYTCLICNSNYIAEQGFSGECMLRNDYVFYSVTEIQSLFLAKNMITMFRGSVGV